MEPTFAKCHLYCDPINMWSIHIVSTEWALVKEAGGEENDVQYLHVYANQETLYTAYFNALKELNVNLVVGGQMESIKGERFLPSAADLCFAVSQGTPHIAFTVKDTAITHRYYKPPGQNDYYWDASWEKMGDTASWESADWYGREPSLFVEQGIPYIAYLSRNSTIEVQYFNGTFWMSHFDRNSFPVTASSPFLIVQNQVPHVAFIDESRGGKATVMTLPPTFEWESLGNAGFSAGPIASPSLVVDQGVFYVAYVDVASNYKATVMRLVGSTWEPVGFAGFTDGEIADLHLAVYDGIPYTAFIDIANGNRPTVMKFDGASWITLGSAGFSPEEVNSVSLSITNGTVYVGYVMPDRTYRERKIEVRCFKG